MKGEKKERKGRISKVEEVINWRLRCPPVVGKPVSMSRGKGGNEGRERRARKRLKNKLVFDRAIRLINLVFFYFS